MTNLGRILVMASLALGVGGCGSDRPRSSDEGDSEVVNSTRIRLDLNIPEGHTVESVHYAVYAGTDTDGDPPPVKTAEADVSARQASASVQLNLAAGPYTVVAHAMADDIPCDGQAAFSVNAGSSVEVTVNLTCIDPVAPETGSAELDANFTFTHPTCGLTKLFVGPLETLAPGGDLITLDAAGTPGVTFLWSVQPRSLGVFEQASAPRTTFDCTEGGTGTLTLTASNPADNCLESKSVSITCHANVAACGDGIVDAPTEECEPPNTAVCSSTCQSFDVDPACISCLQQNCAGLVNACDAAENSDATNGNRCWNLLGCYAQSGCATSQVPHECVCGTFSEIDCAGGEADGQCSSAARRSAGTGGSNNASVLTTLLRFVTDDYAVGDANLLHACNQANCGGCATGTPCYCGDGVLCPAEECEFQDPNCNPQTCTLYVCGNGVLDPNEECDDGNVIDGDACSGDCEIARCGDGIVQTGVEECDPPGTTCSAGCTIREYACSQCMLDFCAPAVLSCDASENVDALNGNRCRNLLDCYERTNCDAVNAIDCVCGTFNEIDCAGGEADGACLAEARRAAGTGGSNNASVLTTLLRFNTADYAIGDANQVSYCFQNNCAGGTCF